MPWLQWRILLLLLVLSLGAISSFADVNQGGGGGGGGGGGEDEGADQGTGEVEVGMEMGMGMGMGDLPVASMGTKEEEEEEGKKEKKEKKKKEKERKEKEKGGGEGIDPEGYLIAPLTMGRFGNQADHLLGTLAFAKALNRTLILSPFITYPPGRAPIHLVPFDSLFRLPPLRSYHRVITMEAFFERHAAAVWPPSKRIGHCHGPAGGTTCPHKNGNPFGPFWDHFNVTFVAYASLPYHYDVGAYTITSWRTALPPSQFPVVALPGAPAPYPVAPQHRQLQQHLRWSREMKQAADRFIGAHVERPFLAVHLRHGSDWERACSMVDGSPFMASPQCHPPPSPPSPPFVLTKDICLPPKEAVLQQVLQAVHQMGAKALFVATDADSFRQDFARAFKMAGRDLKIVQLPEDSPFLDLAIMAQADLFIGNCVSSFSAFVKRERDSFARPSRFWVRDAL